VRVAKAFTSGMLTVLAHALIASVGMVCVTVLAAVHVVTGTDALLVVMGSLGISGPSLGRPVAVGRTVQTEAD
jgi:hypothetical protein